MDKDKVYFISKPVLIGLILLIVIAIGLYLFPSRNKGQSFENYRPCQQVTDQDGDTIIICYVK